MFASPTSQYSCRACREEKERERERERERESWLKRRRDDEERDDNTCSKVKVGES